jgi:NTE family protein
MNIDFGIGRRHAIALSGGGGNAAYEVGVLKALTSGASWVTGAVPLEPAIYTGTSSGAFNAATLVSLSDRPALAGVEFLENLWLTRIALGPERCGNGAYRIRADWRRFLDPACDAYHERDLADAVGDAMSVGESLSGRAEDFFTHPGSLGARTMRLFDVSMFISASPLGRLLESVLRPEVIQASSTTLRIAVTEWTSGELRIFSNRDMTPESAVTIVVASAAIPGFFPPVEAGGDVYVDGGVVMNTPLLPAIEADAEVVHVVYPDPTPSAIPVETLRTTLGSFDRTRTITWARAINQDVQTAKRINQGLDLLESLGRGTAGLTEMRRSLVHAARALGTLSSDGDPYRKLTIHRYHPKEELGGLTGILNMDHDRVRGLIEKGFVDTVNHDCHSSECLMPDGRPAPPRPF